MSYLSKRVALRVLVLALTSALALAVVGAASAEFPTKRSDPSVCEERRKRAKRSTV